jgi:hypothetical protein
MLVAIGYNNIEHDSMGFLKRFSFMRCIMAAAMGVSHMARRQGLESLSMMRLEMLRCLPLSLRIFAQQAGSYSWHTLPKIPFKVVISDIEDFRKMLYSSCNDIACSYEQVACFVLHNQVHQIKVVD